MPERGGGAELAPACFHPHRVPVQEAIARRLLPEASHNLNFLTMAPIPVTVQGIDRH